MSLLSRISDFWKASPREKMTVQYEDSGIVSYGIPIFNRIDGVESTLREQLLSSEMIWLWCHFEGEPPEPEKDPVLARRRWLQSFSVISQDNINPIIQAIMTGGGWDYGEDFTIFGLALSAYESWKDIAWLDDNFRLMPQGTGGVWIIINQLSDVSSQQIFVSPDPTSPIHAMLQTWIGLVGGECVEKPYDARNPWSFERGYLTLKS